jgi:hypothetical protein
MKMACEVVTSILSSKAQEHIMLWIGHSNSTIAELFVPNNGRSSISLFPLVGFVPFAFSMNIYKDLVRAETSMSFLSCSLLDFVSVKTRQTLTICINFFLNQDLKVPFRTINYFTFFFSGLFY